MSLLHHSASNGRRGFASGPRWRQVVEHPASVGPGVLGGPMAPLRLDVPEHEGDAGHNEGC